jgi:hypothetical protein
MHITESLVSDLKALGKNHLIALGLACAGFTVAFSVNKACRWFFDSPHRIPRFDRKQDEVRFIIITMITFGTSAQVNMVLANKYLSNQNPSYDGNLRMLALYITAFALASLRDKRRVIRAAISLSAATAFLHPLFISIPFSGIGALGVSPKHYFND